MSTCIPSASHVPTSRDDLRISPGWGVVVIFLGLIPLTVMGQQTRLSPQESAKRFQVADDLRLDLVLAEPLVRQPISMTFDERGRLWVVQYIQYPQPAGLKVLSRDQFWRVVYDKVPPPPPNHDRGLDRITIHEDTTGNGVYDRHTVFLEGLNIVTSIAHGRGGVWVLNPPYLLYYPTRDDKPTGDPVVHLQGFGLEDTHSCANSLRWGPDGWLYGAHGSTVSSRVSRPGDNTKPISMIGQHIWRYHPESKRFEIVAEGGGNAFGLEIDSQGRFFSGHNGGDTRGFHYVQGGYYRKGFEKHGVLANPFSFGFFEAMKHNRAERFSHTFVINEADGLPGAYRGKLFAVEPLQGRVMLAEIQPDRSSFATQDLGPVVRSSDSWFRPVDIKPGPDGSLYVADFYEDKIAHLRHNDGAIDRDTGRIYRLAARDAVWSKPIDWSKKTSIELVDALQSTNRWQRQTALRLLGDRRDQSIVPKLRALLIKSDGQISLEALWALHLSGGLDTPIALQALDHREPSVRAWTVRLLADENHLGKEVTAALIKRIRSESNVQVRSQWASSSQRLPPGEALPILRELLQHNEDSTDIHIPLLLWWAIEAQCDRNREQVLELFKESSLWRMKLSEQIVLPRLMKRFAMAGTQRDYLTCTELFRLAPEKEQRSLLLKAFEEAFKGRSMAGLPQELLNEIDRQGGGSIALKVRLGKPGAIAQGLELLQNPKTPLTERIELVEIFGEVKQAVSVPALLKTFRGQEPEPLRMALLSTLQSYRDEAIAAQIIEQFSSLSEPLREVAVAALASRREWSLLLLRAVDAGQVAPALLPAPILRKLLLHRDETIAELIRKHWGDIKGATTAEMVAEVNRLARVVRDTRADPHSGKKLYQLKCANCHTLHAQGGKVGPDLTSYKRDDVPQMLLHIINPSAEIREGYESAVITTQSGRTLTGILAEKSPSVVVLRTAEGQQMILPRDDIESLTLSGISLMPEGLLKGLNDQEICDLFAYLRSGQTLPKK